MGGCDSYGWQRDFRRCSVLRETKARYGFDMRGLRLEGARLTFYIKPEDGFMLPLIM
ncbi:MAG: hypothetical protein LBG27_00850 [Spirochaetaceae bacterium]|nr:hypothetical protein [Spirochaetaceae bacterium]